MEMESISLSIWFLIGASLVFFMQCGFAMVECGFTRAKNAGNIIMKNLMDFCIGTVMFIILGYGIMKNPHVAGGFIGTINWDMFGSGFSGFFSGLPALRGYLSGVGATFSIHAAR